MILYLVFGVFTTVVSLGAFWIGGHVFGWHYSLNYVVSQLLAILFAYITNRVWVFHSKAQGIGEIIVEFVKFMAGRAVTFVMGWLILFVAVGLLKQNQDIWNLIQNILVIIFNYVISKLFVFKKKGVAS
jgi:putative flippase GtrA